MSATAPSRPRLPWQVVLLATALATLAALIVLLVLDRDEAAVGGTDTAATIPLTPTEEPSGDTDPADALTVTFTTVDGGDSTLAEVLDGPTVVNFFASWCAPCISEMPDFEAVSQELTGRVGFFGLAVQDRPEDAERIVGSTGITYPWARDVRGDVLGAAGAIQMPTTMLVDADGTVVYLHSGALDADRLRALIAEHFGIEP